MRDGKIKNILIRAAGAVFALCLLVVSLVYCTTLLERKDSREKYGKFFEHASDMDVILLGTSHVLNSVFPWSFGRITGSLRIIWADMPIRYLRHTGS